MIIVYRKELKRSDERGGGGDDLEQGRPEQGDQWIEEEGTRVSRDASTPVS